MVVNMAILDKLKSWFLNHLSLIFCLLRDFKPVLAYKNTILITRFKDVQEVLSLSNVFGVTYTEKMGYITHGSNFFLGMNNTPEYERDVSNMRISMRRSDVETIIAPMIQKISNDIINDNNGNIDVVQDVSQRVPARFVKNYLGIPGRNEDELIDWATIMFQYLFFPDNPKEIDEKAQQYASEARNYIDEYINNYHQNKINSQSDTVLDRCLALGSIDTPSMTNIDIRNNLIGMIIGAIPTTSKCVALVLDYLFDHPSIMQGAKKAALDNNMELMKKYVMEILRLNSFGPGVFRIALQDYVIGSDTGRATVIKKDSNLLVCTQSAMLDGTILDNPNEFKIDRPEYHYMLFGYGMHECFGRYINLVQIPIIVATLLRQKNLRRRDKNEKMTYNGPFPLHLYVIFDK
jgi:cytochrome P450